MLTELICVRLSVTLSRLAFSSIVQPKENVDVLQAVSVLLPSPQEWCEFLLASVWTEVNLEAKWFLLRAFLSPALLLPGTFPVLCSRWIKRILGLWNLSLELTDGYYSKFNLQSEHAGGAIHASWRDISELIALCSLWSGFSSQWGSVSVWKHNIKHT